jgi:hypothetical protein
VLGLALIIALIGIFGQWASNAVRESRTSHIKSGQTAFLQKGMLEAGIRV